MIVETKQNAISAHLSSTYTLAIHGTVHDPGLRHILTLVEVGSSDLLKPS